MFGWLLGIGVGLLVVAIIAAVLFYIDLLTKLGDKG